MNSQKIKFLMFGINFSLTVFTAQSGSTLNDRNFIIEEPKGLQGIVPGGFLEMEGLHDPLSIASSVQRMRRFLQEQRAKPQAAGSSGSTQPV